MVRQNAATMRFEKTDAALISGDIATVEALVAESVVVVDHPTGATYDRDGLLAILRSAQRAEHLAASHEPIATLGASLVLGNRRASIAGMPEEAIASWGE